MRQHTLVRRQHPIFSPVAIVSTLLLAGALGVAVYMTGGRAFSPGELSAVNNNGEAIGNFMTHDEFGDDCRQCHTPFQGVETALCETCHENVAQQRQTKTGLHGRFETEIAEDCAACHRDHKGHEYDLGQAALAEFDHDLTGFYLVKHGVDYAAAPLDCAGCHLNAGDFTVPATACADCHREANSKFMTRHGEGFGDDCLACHDGLDTMAAFTAEDHERAFALTGAHATVVCESCHADGRFDDTPEQCVACHAEPEVHQGLFGAGCADCHTTDDWKLVFLDGQAFNHTRDTSFNLVKHLTNYDGDAFACRDCHISQEQFKLSDAGCANCHGTADPSFMADHIALFGENCISCHDGSGAMTNFDHSLVWPLEGQHALIECVACHIDRVFQGTPGECVACHAEPEIHAGLFGTNCDLCHTTQAWLPARLSEHTFPLDHGDQGEIPCATCHTTAYTEYTCDNCHNPGEMERKHQEEGIRSAELANCVKCHPTGREKEAEGEDD